MRTWLISYQYWIDFFHWKGLLDCKNLSTIRFSNWKIIREVLEQFVQIHSNFYSRDLCFKHTFLLNSFNQFNEKKIVYFPLKFYHMNVSQNFQKHLRINFMILIDFLQFSLFLFNFQFYAFPNALYFFFLIKDVIFL